MASSSYSPAPSTSVPQLMKLEEPVSNWAELQPEMISSILLRLNSIKILGKAQKVCRSWRASSADRSSSLRSLRLAMCCSIRTGGLAKALAKLPLLEELEFSYCSLTPESLRVVGRSCPNLKTLKLNREGFRALPFPFDSDALTIAETMHELRHLQLSGNTLTGIGLSAILDNCPNLEHLDLLQCFNVNLVGDLETRSSQKIKVLRRPYDSTLDYPYVANVIDIDSSCGATDQSDFDPCSYDLYDIDDDLYSL